tara:strand:- start:18 stop:707 length:690 start_codon:yes stop_codon:yes gene_type:complete
MAKRSRLIKLETYQHRQSGIQARSLNQRVLDKWLHDPQKDIVIAVGPAGTGKTLLACDRGMLALHKGLYEKIIVTRPTVSVDEQLGYLPGDMNEKMEPWTRPIYDVFLSHLKDGELISQIKNRNIEVCPLAYMRGRTFKNSWIIADEMQNATKEQMKMLLTRIGEGSKIVVTGDLKQHDRGYNTNGLKDFIERLKMTDVEHIALAELNNEDILRHPAVAKVLELYELTA